MGNVHRLLLICERRPDPACKGTREFRWPDNAKGGRPLRLVEDFLHWEGHTPTGGLLDLGREPGVMVLPGAVMVARRTGTHDRGTEHGMIPSPGVPG